MNTLILRRGKAESLKRFHPWIFSGAILGTQPRNTPLTEGEIVRIVDAEGQFLAIGHYQIGSISVRVLTFHDEPIDHAFWVRRLRQAFAMRAALGLNTAPERNNIYRLVHGEGDQLPGLVIDVLDRKSVV